MRVVNVVLERSCTQSRFTEISFSHYSQYIKYNLKFFTDKIYVNMLFLLWKFETSAGNMIY